MSVLPVFVPHTHVREATRVFLAYQKQTNPIHYVDVAGDKWAYVDYWQQRWDEGVAFVSLEHDVVPWPGAIEDLQGCPEQWCFFSYVADMDCSANRCAPFGLVKFGAKLIAAVPDVWKQLREAFAEDPKPWCNCDIFMYRYVAEGRGIAPHQHHPAVLNANPQSNQAYFPLVEPAVTQVRVWRDMDPVTMVEVRGDAQFSTRSELSGYRVTVNRAAVSLCCNKCGSFYSRDEGGARRCEPCGFYPDGYPLERMP